MGSDTGWKQRSPAMVFCVRLPFLLGEGPFVFRKFASPQQRRGTFSLPARVLVNLTSEQARYVPVIDRNFSRFIGDVTIDGDTGEMALAVGDHDPVRAEWDGGEERKPSLFAVSLLLFETPRNLGSYPITYLPCSQSPVVPVPGTGMVDRMHGCLLHPRFEQLAGAAFESPCSAQVEHPASETASL